MTKTLVGELTIGYPHPTLSKRKDADIGVPVAGNLPFAIGFPVLESTGGPSMLCQLTIT